MLMCSPCVHYADESESISINLFVCFSGQKQLKMWSVGWFNHDNLTLRFVVTIDDTLSI